eukprot:CAMPEP_0171323698 /NCGR_PEP_ID=MMETSP0816-20121228/115739_1 /TAXON_ID=420281 /ORGANISM="Proboscia inermis, Strain CCAP1064/1" /LENGTH=111 /DNA_ID=CAMNT_0011822477 /DNA_START=566 /DNA_END=901 /DNA_ORIENTATION=+
MTKNSTEEKFVERIQQKLNLDAMVVQHGHLNNKDKLSRDSLLDAVRFGADRVFKRKDLSISDDDIDMILNIGKKKTLKMNEKLQKSGTQRRNVDIGNNHIIKRDEFGYRRR